MQTGFGKLIMALADICFPPRCLICDLRLAPGTEILFCQACVGQIRLIGEPFCPCCGMPFRYAAGGNHLCAECLAGKWHFTYARAVMEYSYPATEAILAFKFQGKTSGLATFRRLSVTTGVLAGFAEPDLILPVPLHVKRLQERGFNQSILLARKFYPEDTVKIKPNLLERHKPTPPQTRLNGKARRQNVRGAFRVKNKEQVKGKRVLLVDDVFTTGATVDECARILARAGAKEVQVLTLARVVE